MVDKIAVFCYHSNIDTQKGLKMSKLVNTRVLEICPGEWVVQFEGGLNGWTTFSDTFATQAEAQAFEAEQIASADFGDQEWLAKLEESKKKKEVQQKKFFGEILI